MYKMQQKHKIILNEIAEIVAWKEKTQKKPSYFRKHLNSVFI